MTDLAIKTLAAGVATLGESVRGMEGELPVLVCAVAALVGTHPDGRAFAAAFRQAWLQIGAPNQALGTDDPTGCRMRALLDILEERCSAPLNIRPPAP